MPTETKIRLIPITVELLRVIGDKALFQQGYAALATAEELALLREPIEQSLEFYTKIGATDPWTGYIVALHDPAKVVGCCGFKGNPDQRGAVEISYYTLPHYENLGYATATAAKMVDLARHHGISVVIAHTLPTQNASGRLLEKNGFQLVGPTEDPDDGTVWLWEKAITLDSCRD